MHRVFTEDHPALLMPVDVQALATETRESSKAAVFAMAISVAALAIGVVLYFVTQDEVKNIEEVQAQNTESMEVIEGEIAGLSKDVTSMGADLPSALDQARQSTYLVILRDEDGFEQPFGTAWVMAPVRSCPPRPLVTMVTPAPRVTYAPMASAQARST